MKEVVILVAALAGVGFLVKRFAPELGTIDWEKKLEAMPDNAPPKWMFRNVTAIGDNTDRILELLEGRTADGAATQSSVRVGGDFGGVVERKRHARGAPRHRDRRDSEPTLGVDEAPTVSA